MWEFENIDNRIIEIVELKVILNLKNDKKVYLKNPFTRFFEENISEFLEASSSGVDTWMTSLSPDLANERSGRFESAYLL